MDTSDSSNWIKLHMLLNHASATLQKLFINAWKLKFNCEWNTSQADIIKNEVKNIGNDQVKSIEDGDVSKWDITLLRAILFADFLYLRNDQKESIRSIVDIRNKINHLPSNAIPQEQFDQWWKRLVLNLVGLGASEIELEQLKVNSRVGGVEILKKEEIINEANKIRAALLEEEGNVALKNENYSSAIELFTEGINLPEISNRDRAVLLSNRVISYLKLNESVPDNNLLKNGREDAKEVIRLCPEWWRGYYRLGQVHIGLRNYQDAIEYLIVALAKAPQIKEIGHLLSNARYLRGEDDRMEYLDPYSQITSTADYVSKINKELGLNTSVNEEKENEALWAKMGVVEVENWTICRNGTRCRFGTDGFPRDYREAAKYYEMAADRGSPEGMVGLGQLYFEGLGVSQDFDQAFKMYEKAADQPLYIGETHIPNYGVAEAQSLLALCYFEGTGVVKNLTKAVSWYQKSSENGCSGAASNLGVMYENGIMDNTPDVKKAEEYYRIAANHPVNPKSAAMLNLAFLYRKKGEYERALDWCHRAEINGSRHPKLYELKFEIKKKLDFFQEAKVVDWELEHGKSCDGLTIAQRMNRYLAQNNEELFSSFEIKIAFMNKQKWTSRGYINSRRIFDRQELQNCAKHSAYGQTLWTAKKYYLNAEHIMVEELMECETLPVSRYKAFIEEFSAGVQIEIIVLEWPSKVCDQALAIIKMLLNQKTPFDEDVRICYVGLYSITDPTEAVIFLDECIRRYPQNVFFIKTRACMKARLRRYEHGLRDAKLALKLDPENIEILHDQALMMKLTGTHNAEAVIEAYKLFLKLAPKDHRKVPESYYTIALTILQTLKGSESVKESNVDEDLSKIKHFYDLGKEAENDQLRFFLPYESNSKVIVEFNFPVTAKRWQSSLSLPCTSDQVVTKESSELRPNLIDPDRKLKICRHRIVLHSQQETASSSRSSVYKSSTFKPPKDQRAPKSLAGLTSISLDGMGPNVDFVHEGCVLTATVIDDLFIGGRTVFLLLADRYGCVERCLIYDLSYVNDVNRVKKVFCHGRKLNILNPYMRMAGDGRPAIRVDDPDSIVFQGKIKQMCRYCCKPNANRRCGRCKVAFYCDENCQTPDWEELEHKFVCKPLTTTISSVFKSA